MGTSNRAIALLAMTALASGCFGYNRSAKAWSYVGDSVLILGGGGAIAADVLTKSDPCMTTATTKCGSEAPFSGALLTGVVLVTAGLFGMVFNATRPNVKTSR